MTKNKPTVFIVDDDDAIRDSLQMLMSSVGLESACYASAREFLTSYDPDRPGCLVLDVRMPGMSGIDLQERLVAMNSILPIIFITGHGEVPMAVHAMRAGAVDFIQKPFSEQALLDQIHLAVEQDAKSRAMLGRRDAIVERIASLTPRERQVMEMVIDGMANKVIAIDLGVSERTVEIHRARVMQKMGAESLPHLVRMAIQVRD
jgi:two-component system, LuxR family, response regulator FixJ